MINSVLSRFTNLYAVWVIGASIIAFFVPGLFNWFSGPWVTWALTIIMLGMGLTLTIDNFRGVWRMPRPVALGFCAQYTIMPLTAWGIATVMKLDAPLAVGLILVGCCPGGTASNVVTYLARANVALSVVLTMTSTLLAIVMTPLLMQLLAGHYVPIDAYGIFKTTFQVVLLPVVLGVFLSHRFPKFGAAASQVGPAIAVVAIVMIAGSIVANNVEAIAGHGVQLAIAGLLLHTMGFIFGYFVTRLFRYKQNTARTVSIEVGMQNSGLAMVLANQHFAAATATPAVFSSVFHTLVGSLAAAWWRMRPPADEDDGTEIEGSSRDKIYYWKCDRPAAFHGIRSKTGSERRAELGASLEKILRRRMNAPDLTMREANGQGDHLTYHAAAGGKRYFVRVQDGPEKDRYIEVEAVVQDAVRDMGVPTPRVFLADASRSEVACAYQVLEYFESPDLNHYLKRGELTETKVAARIGRDIARWQRIRPAGFGPFDPSAARRGKRLVGLHKSYRDYFRLNWKRHLNFLVDHGFLERKEADDLDRAVEAHDHLLHLQQGCLVHKDLALWNILGTPSGVSAYVDWGDTISGDPTDDLSLLACFHGREFLAAAIASYETEAGLPENFAPRFWLHLLRNMVVKATIRVGSGYFSSEEELFLVPKGGNGRSFETFTKDRLWAAYCGLTEKKEVLGVLEETPLS